MPMNLPNQITLGRLLLAAVFFAVLSTYSAGRGAEDAWKLSAAFCVFLAAALSDVLDGWLARRLRQVTAFGRVLDPVVDKVMVCGAFVFFSSDAFFDPARAVNVSGVAPWMVIVILLREFTVSVLRAFSESHGDSFAANWVGKLKMFVQSATVCVVLGVLAWFPQPLANLRVACVWLTVAVTAASCAAYLHRGRSLVFPPAGSRRPRSAPGAADAGSAAPSPAAAAARSASTRAASC